MPERETYGARVAARTRAAAELLRSKELLALYEDKGGLREDLEEIRDLGLQAEALAQQQRGAKAKGDGATLAVLQDFAGLQKEYTAVMAVVLAVRRELARKGETETAQALEQILVNEAAVVLRPAPGGAPAEGEGGEAPKKKKKAVRSKSQEAVRAEIYRDAEALLQLKAAHAGLQRRKVTPARLKALRDSAQGLTSKLSDRASKKGAGKAATEALVEVVSAQRQAWSAHYRILAAAAQDDQRVRQLLAEAARRRR